MCLCLNPQSGAHLLHPGSWGAGGIFWGEALLLVDGNSICCTGREAGSSAPLTPLPFPRPHTHLLFNRWRLSLFHTPELPGPAHQEKRPPRPPKAMNAKENRKSPCPKQVRSLEPARGGTGRHLVWRRGDVDAGMCVARETKSPAEPVASPSVLPCGREEPLGHRTCDTKRADTASPKKYPETAACCSLGPFTAEPGRAVPTETCLLCL